MILENIDELDENNYPILIVGSGPAGLTLALELEKKNIRTVIIEAGGEEYDDKSQSFYKINTKDATLKDISNSRLRQFGGTSAIWGGWCKPLTDLDFKNLVDEKIINDELQYVSKSSIEKKIVPHFLVDKSLTTNDLKILLNGLKIVGDYLDKTILKPNNLTQPISRINFINSLK